MKISNSIWILSIIIILIVICEVRCKPVPNNNRVSRKDNKESRCGTDNLYVFTRPRVRRVAGYTDGGGSRWNTTDITYRIWNEARTLVEERVEALVAKAFAAWAPYCGLRFVRVPPPHPAPTSLSPSRHADMQRATEFDGLGHLLAHASYPRENGTYIHFDDDETWGDLVEEPTSAKDKGIVFDFYSTALHEIGHTLGLGHTEENLAIMYPYNQATSLHEDDISIIRKLYNYFEVTEATIDDDYSSDDDKSNGTARIDGIKKYFSMIDSIENNYVSTDFNTDDPLTTDSIEDINLSTLQGFKTSSTTYRSSEVSVDDVTDINLTDTIELSTDLYATKDFTSKYSSTTFRSTKRDDIPKTGLTDTTELPTDLYAMKNFTFKDSWTTFRSTEMDNVTNTDLSTHSDSTELVTDLYSTPKLALTTRSLNNSTEKVVVTSKATSKISATSFFGLCGFFTCFAIVAYYMRSKLIG